MIARSRLPLLMLLLPASGLLVAAAPPPARSKASGSAGRVTMRRLNREEYNNTIRDLTGLDLRPADDFPSDDVGYGFDNIGDVLSISPLLLDKYVVAAEKIAQAAIITPEARAKDGSKA